MSGAPIGLDEIFDYPIYEWSQSDLVRLRARYAEFFDQPPPPMPDADQYQAMHSALFMDKLPIGQAPVEA
jgi:hypothetical protein